MKQHATPAAKAVPGVRLDVWLWATRFFKTRALAKQAIEGGKVEVGASSAKPATLVQVGNRMWLLIAGLVVFLGLHSVRIVAGDWRMPDRSSSTAHSRP